MPDIYGNIAGPGQGGNTVTCRGDQECQYATGDNYWYCSGREECKILEALCRRIEAYDAEWNQLSNTQLAKLEPGNIVRFAAKGRTDDGKFDKARFTINGTLMPEVTTIKPESGDLFYYEYTIPEGVKNFEIIAEVHHKQKNKWYK